MLRTTQLRKYSTHIKYGVLIASLITGGGLYHISHPIIHTINKALDTAKAGESVDLNGHIGCVPWGLKGAI
jgi:hypothetical protein